MSQEIYEHLPPWRRALRELAIEAGLPQFKQESQSPNHNFGSDPDVAARKKEPDRPTDPLEDQEPTRVETKSKPQRGCARISRELT